MKTLMLFVAVFFINEVSTQVLEVPKPGGNLVINGKRILPLEEAKLLYGSDKVKIYALPLDKMPCLVPKINSNMPVAKININDYKKMPNALPEQKIIPDSDVQIIPGNSNNKKIP